MDGTYARIPIELCKYNDFRRRQRYARVAGLERQDSRPAAARFLEGVHIAGSDIAARLSIDAYEGNFKGTQSIAYGIHHNAMMCKDDEL